MGWTRLVLGWIGMVELQLAWLHPLLFVCCLLVTCVVLFGGSDLGGLDCGLSGLLVVPFHKCVLVSSASPPRR